MIGSVLTCTIIEARELRSTRITGLANPYVVLMVEGQKSTSEVQPNTVDPVWNEVVSFDITTGRENLMIQIYDNSGVTRDTLIGECQVPMQELYD